MKWLTKIGWWGLDRCIVLTINEAKSVYRGELTCATANNVVSSEAVEFGELSELLGWVAQRPDLPVFLILEMEEVAEGIVQANSTDWITDVLGVKVAQPGLFWCQAKEGEAGTKRVAVIRKTVLEASLAAFAEIEDRLVGFSLFKNTNFSKFLSRKTISLPKQIISNRVQFNRSLWISRLAVVVSCCCLIASLCFFLLSPNLRAQTSQNQQQIAAFLPQLDSIQQNEASITRLAHHLQQTKQMKPTAFSYFADQIAAVAPPKLSFQELIFAPDAKERKLISPELKHDSLDFILTGSSQEALAITDFSNAMQKLSGMESVQLLETPFDREAGVYLFSMKGQFKKGKDEK
jgi:hypothetical protein